uniref:LIM zinc-binding domain-containing protein n=1 Tax=Plectus sambesii TaxID=2011161 RepID=A0A914VEB4_9BILA
MTSATGEAARSTIRPAVRSTAADGRSVMTELLELQPPVRAMDTSTGSSSPVDIKPENTILCTCMECQDPIRDKFILKVVDNAYHATCLRCSECAEPLTTKCFIKDDAVYCKDDFYKKFGTKCSYCDDGIAPQSVIRKANEHVYHMQCFKCIICKREMATGEEFYLIPADGRLVCKADYESAKNKGELR